MCFLFIACREVLVLYGRTEIFDYVVSKTIHHDLMRGISYITILNNQMCFLFVSCREVLVLYGGTEIFDYEVSETIHHDLMLAIPCIISIAILLFILTSFSLWLTICGCLSILLSFAWAYFVFHVLCGIDALGLLNLVSAFVVIGIGESFIFFKMKVYRASLYNFKLAVASMQLSGHCVCVLVHLFCAHVYAQYN